MSKTLVADTEYKNMARDFPGGPVVKNPPPNAENTGLIPGRGTKIPHASGQLSPRAATTEHVSHSWREACALQRKIPRAAKQTSRVPQLRPNAAKNKINK